MLRFTRRNLLIAASAALASPRIFAQPSGRRYRVGVFLTNREPAMRRYLDELRARLRQHGFEEGRNLDIQVGRTVFNPDADRKTVAALLAAPPDALFTFTTVHTQTAQSLKAPVPIVFTFVGDPVAYGLVKDIRRPGGDTTGASTQQREIKPKRLEFLRELLPNAKRVGVVGYTGDSDLLFARNEAALRAAARTLGFDLSMEPGWQRNGGFIPAMDRAAQGGAEAFYIFHPLAVHGFVFGGDDVIKFAQERRIPTVFEESELVEMGGLMSYGTSLVDEIRRSADQLARILKGAIPAELPVDLAARFELAVNVKTANTLGIAVPKSILVRAHRVIE